MTSSHERTCPELEDELPLLAIGALTGRERAAVLRHVESCQSCAGELESYGASVDAMVMLLPEAEPPEGLADSVLERMHQGESPPVRRTWRHLVLAAAAVVVALGVGAGTYVAVQGRTAAKVTVGTLQSQSGVTGRVVLTSEPEPRLAMHVESENALAARVTCVITLADGRRETAGTFWLGDGYGSWTTSIPAPVSRVRAVSLEDPRGTTLATARVG